MKRYLALAVIALLDPLQLGAWGLRGHTVANLAAVEGIPADGPAFLKSMEPYIGHLGTIPDMWRGYRRLAAGASFLRDLVYTAWIESSKPMPRVDELDRMENPNNPRYNPAAGSAPARCSPPRSRRKRQRSASTRCHSPFGSTFTTW